MNTSRTTQKRLTWASSLAPLAAIAVALPLITAAGKAQVPRLGEARTAQGRVQGFTTAPMGEEDGATFDDGTVIHWPPHLADRFTAVVAKGDSIRVAGRMETGPDGDTHLEAQTVTNLRTNASAENDFGPPAPRQGCRLAPPPPPPGPRFGETKTAQGRVQSLTTAPRGEVDEATLDDGTIVHWPLHLADRLTAVASKGERIKVTRWIETGPAGDTHLEVRTVTNLCTDATASNEIAGLPAGSGPIAPDGSGEFAASPERGGDVERRLKGLEDQIAKLREEIRKIRDEL